MALCVPLLALTADGRADSKRLCKLLWHNGTKNKCVEILWHKAWRNIAIKGICKWHNRQGGNENSGRRKE